MFLCLLRALKISRFMQGMPMESGATDRWKTGGRMKNASEIQRPQFVVDEKILVVTIGGKGAKPGYRYLLWMFILVFATGSINFRC